MQINSQGERMKEIEIFGIPALFSSNRIAPEDVYPGMYRYELLSSKEVPAAPAIWPRTVGMILWERY